MIIPRAAIVIFVVKVRSCNKNHEYITTRYSVKNDPLEVRRRLYVDNKVPCGYAIST